MNASIYPGAPHGIIDMYRNQLHTDLPAFLQSFKCIHGMDASVRACPSTLS